jgi:hypothetical protein
MGSPLPGRLDLSDRLEAAFRECVETEFSEIGIAPVQRLWASRALICFSEVLSRLPHNTHRRGLPQGILPAEGDRGYALLIGLLVWIGIFDTNITQMSDTLARLG